MRMSSLLLSTLKHSMPVFNAKSISSTDLPTPENTTPLGAAGSYYAAELTTGHNIKACAKLSKRLQNSQRRIGFDGVVQLMERAQGAVQLCILAFSMSLE